jgi:fructose-bisphosphate aldolase class II
MPFNPSYDMKNCTKQIMERASVHGVAVPAFNVPYLPMLEPIAQAIADQNSFALIEVARLEWMKFESQSCKAVMEEYVKHQNPSHTRIHLDHVPVIDEDGLTVDFLAIIEEAIGLGYESVMVDGSRLPLNENIAATKQVVKLAHAAGIPCEAELGAVLGHEEGPLPPYEELFESGKGFTDIEEAKRFVAETGCDWLSVAVGNIHGNISKAKKDLKKVQAKLNLDHLDALHTQTGIPLVLHGGSGVQQEFVLKATKHGITKINIGTDIRQPYEVALVSSGDLDAAKEAVYARTSWVLRDYLQLTDTKDLLLEA